MANVGNFESVIKEVSQGGKAMEAGYYQVKEKTTAALDGTVSFIKKFPIQSALVGFGIGWLLGLVTKPSASRDR